MTTPAEVDTEQDSRTLEVGNQPVVIVTDLHGRFDALRWVLNHHGPDATYIQLGDLSDDYRSLERIAGLLLEKDIKGVYGNHDFGLILAVRGKASIDRVSRVVLDYCRNLTRKIVVGPFLFCHDDPTTDYQTVVDAWDPRLIVLTVERARPILESLGEHRAVITGHAHLSQVLTLDGAHPLHPGVPYILEDGPYYVSIGALADGYYASLEPTTGKLTLHRIPAGAIPPSTD